MPKLLDPPPPKPVLDALGQDPKAPPVERTTTITLLMVQLFSAPIPMGALYNGVNVLPRFSINPNNGTALSAQLTIAEIAAMLTAFKAGLAQFAVALFTNNITPNPNLQWSNITEPTGTWYAEVDSTLGAVEQFPDGNIGLVGTSAAWAYTGSSPAQNIVGWAGINVVTS